jgi:hypothetical protein
MQGKLVAVFAVFGAVGARADWSVEEKQHPVSKVIAMMKDMTAQLQKEGEEDDELYETMGCWCKTNDEEKTKAISDAETKIEKLQSLIEELTGKSARLNEEIKTLTAEVARNEQALDTASALRTKQLAEFNAEEKDALGSITSLKGAVATLSKHNGAFLQVTDQKQLNTLAAVRSIVQKHAADLAGAITPTQRRKLESALSPALLQSKSEQPASGEIFGILGQMKETFETNLANSQKEETSNQRAFEDLKKAKTDEIASGRKAIEQKTAELADTDLKNADSKEDLEDTQDTLEADTKFLADVKEKCAGIDAEYAERTKTRQMEMAAVAKAMEFLTSDEAHELFTRALGASFMQKASRSHRQGALVALLNRAAAASHDPRLSAMATKMRLNSFTKVKATLQTMVDKLTAEKEEEIKQKDICIDGFNKNEKETELNERKKSKLIATIEDLQMQQDELTKAIAALNQQMADMRLQMKRAGEDREIENKDFQLVLADQRATQKLLIASLNILKGFYEKAALVQEKKTGAKQPANFKTYEKNQQSGGLMGMMQGIINDSKMAEAEAITAEEDSQKAYELFVKDTNESLTEKTKSLINKQEVNGKVEAKKAEKEVQRDETLAQLEQLAAELHDLHISCDYLLKNYEIRTQARDEEVEALKQAIAMFSGASFNSFLESLGPDGN